MTYIGAEEIGCDEINLGFMVGVGEGVKREEEEWLEEYDGL